MSKNTLGFRWRRMMQVAAWAAAGVAAPCAAGGQVGAPEPTARDTLIDYLTTAARQQSAARAATIAAITTADEAHRRQLTVRSTLADLIHFETYAGPVRSEVTHSSRADGYTIDALWYESLPDYRVTADLYRPAGAGPFPAIILQPGHGIDGKIGDHALAAALARAGFVVLSIDVVGEGERLQFYDAEIGASKVGRPTGEHSMAFGQALPTGGHVSRFFIQDAVRGVDYLMSRTDVDDRRIGAFGCSGGGTITAYLAAMDPRIAATAVGCYVNGMTHLLARGGPGPQDAEQSIPFFLERGLDLPDWIEMAAPRPYAVVSTTSDMFPIEGARAAFAEARRFYDTLGAADRITMIEGPGGHGALAPIMPQIVAFFTHWLKNDPAQRPFRPEPVGDPARLLVYPAGGSGNNGGGRTLQAMIAAERPRGPVPNPGEGPAKRLARLQLAIRTVARTTVSPGGPAPALAARGSLAGPLARAGYRVEALRFAMAPGLSARALYTRANQPGRRPTLLLLSSQPLDRSAAAGGPVERWAKAGWNVLLLEARGAGGTEELKSPLTGDWTLLSLRALMVGKTPVGMRVDDAVAGLNWLVRQPEVDARRLAVSGAGALGPVALHVGVLDPRVAAVVSESAITRYAEFVERPISRDMAEVNLPGVLTHYDLPDLMTALGRKLTLVGPVNAVGEPIPVADVAALAPAARVVVRVEREPAGPELLSLR